MVKRCWKNIDSLMLDYHDNEWGNPVHDDRKWFEFLILDGFQAGLSWKTILNKRKEFNKAFDQFEFEKIAKYDEKKLEELIQNPRIIRNRLKINATVTNANAYIKLRKEYGSFDKYIWEFVDNKTIQNNWKSWDEVHSKTEISEKISKDLKKKGFKFVGPTIVYDFMQAAGMVNDHLIHCFRHKDLKNE